MKSVLIVDDSAVMRRMMRNTITNIGYEVAGEARNGRVGVEKYKELRPDIVTMDVTMDEMNGIEALKVILEIDPDAKVVMVSSMGQKLVVKEAILSGAKGFVLKPFEDWELKNAFSKL